MIDGTAVGTGSWEWVWDRIAYHCGVIGVDAATEIRLRIDRPAQKVTPNAGVKRDKENQ